MVEAHLARIDDVNPALNAIVRRLDDEAAAAADAADQALAHGDDLGPLHGVPFTVKENIDLAGTPTTQAIVVLADAIAEHRRTRRRTAAQRRGDPHRPDQPSRPRPACAHRLVTARPHHATRGARGSPPAGRAVARPRP